MRCSHCGTENKDNAKFCMYCGQKLEEPASGCGPTVGHRAWILAALCLIAVAAAMGVILLRPHADQPVGDEEVKDIPTVLEDMRQANGGELPEIYFSDTADEGPQYILGCYCDAAITDAEDAIDSLGTVAPLYGISDPKGEFQVVSETEQFGTHIYKLQQYYHGVEVFGRQLVVSADGRSKAATLGGSYANGIDIHGSVPTNAPAGMDLVVYVGEDGNAEYGWKSDSTSEIVVYSADLERTLYSSSKIEESVQTVALADNEELDVNVRDLSDGMIELFDEQRNLVVFDASGKELTAMRLVKNGSVVAGTYGFDYTWYGEPFDGRTFKESDLTQSDSDGTYSVTIDNSTVSGMSYEDLMSEDKKAVIWLDDSMEDVAEHVQLSTDGWQDNSNNRNAMQALAFVTEAYDYYQTLDSSWRGYDGANGLFRIVVNNNMGEEDNAWSWGNLITFSKKAVVDRMTIAHEFTHSVMGVRSGDIGGQGESGALKEAYADIMACAITNNTSWHYDEGRRLDDPASGKTDTNGDGVGDCSMPVRYQGENWFDTSSEFDSGGRHINCVVIGHAAYLMYKEGMTMDEVGRLWFASMPYLTTFASFRICRCAVTAAALSLGYDESKVGIIKDAFDAVGVGRDEILLASDAEIRVLNSDGSPHEGAKIELKNYSPVDAKDGVEDISVSQVMDSSSIRLGELFKEARSGVAPPSTSLQKFVLTVSDTTDDSVSVSTVIMIAESGLSRLDIDLGTPGDSEQPVDESQYTIHFSTADLVLPEALRGKVNPVVDETVGDEERVHYEGMPFLTWCSDTSWLDRAREGGEPTDNADVDSQTLSDGTQLIFGVANDGFCYVEIIGPQGHRGILWSCIYDEFVADMVSDPSAVDACRQLQASAAGMSEDEDAYDIAMAFLRVCAERVIFTGDAPTDGQAATEVVLGRTPEGTYLLAGTVRVHEEYFRYSNNPDYVDVVSLVLDEQVPYQYEYKGTVDAVAQEVALETERSEGYGTWAQYDGQHIVIECDDLRGVYHDNANLNVDTMAMGGISLVSTG